MCSFLGVLSPDLGRSCAANMMIKITVVAEKSVGKVAGQNYPAVSRELASRAFHIRAPGSTMLSYSRSREHDAYK